jgi:hypothetical protein
LNGDRVTHPPKAEFEFAPQPTVFVVNVIHAHPDKQEEAFKIIRDENNVDEFFSDPAFVEKFKKLDAVSKSEFHIYKVSDLVLPRQLLG